MTPGPFEIALSTMTPNCWEDDEIEVTVHGPIVEDGAAAKRVASKAEADADGLEQAKDLFGLLHSPDKNGTPPPAVRSGVRTLAANPGGENPRRCAPRASRLKG
jgi:hypothetical protein